MFNKLFLTTTVCSLLLSGCSVSPPLKQVPSTIHSTSNSFISNELPSSTQKYASTNIEGTYFGVSGASGSVAVGLLFGPIGVAANVAHVNSVNKERVAPLTNLTSQNLSKILSQEISTIQSGNDRSSASYKITPAANLYFKSNNAYFLGCTITAELTQTNGTKPWKARYAIPVEGIFDSSSASDTIKASGALAPCLHNAYELFNEHITGKLGVFDKRTVTNQTIDDKKTTDQILQVAVSKLPEKILVNDTWGVFELRRSEITQIK